MTRPAALPRWLQPGLDRAERERKANLIARPMRNLMDMLRQGEVFELDGRAVMRMPEVDEQFASRAEWCEIAPAIRGWIDCWGRLARCTMMATSCGERPRPTRATTRAGRWRSTPSPAQKENDDVATD